MTESTSLDTARLQGSAADKGPAISRALVWSLVLLSVIYAVQVASPLRIDGDAAIYLEAGRSLAAGDGYVVQG